jgi:hypothetical protein
MKTMVQESHQHRASRDERSTHKNSQSQTGPYNRLTLKITH